MHRSRGRRLTAPALSMIAGLFIFIPRFIAAQQPAPASTNKLLTAKLIYVAPLQGGLDRWLRDDLRGWNRYRLTSNPEGVDLYVRTAGPKKQPQLVLRQGVPRPKRQRREPPAQRIEVVNWVTGETLWGAELLDRRPKDVSSAPGPNVMIGARGLKPDQLAAIIVRNLRQYVQQLETSKAGPAR